MMSGCVQVCLGRRGRGSPHRKTGIPGPLDSLNLIYQPACFLASAGGATQGVLVFFALMVLIVARRIYRNVVGVRVSHARTIGWTVFYFLFSGFFLATSFLEGVPAYYGVLDAAFLAGGALVSHRVAARRLRFWKAADGSVFYKGGFVIYLVYVVGLAARLGIELLLIGPSAFTFSPISLGQTAVVGLVLADALFSFGYGLLGGRNVRVFSMYTAIARGRLQVPGSGLDS